ncbi:Golgi apparatus membrane protein tvp18 [Talaromyces atroroseus]|uniref:Golgi apparatus membrane protein tvp18 n=1 Tax=Talaromyces atroroseus TaxID=1441469 RepID=A0A1Q5QC70_TALAT|nr:Golgi apparatus membrane protein tvp18 [Talaromyces atroroseus]OKL63418.1 Golgi apparatus membrane protein tvp18 [Talaromyces atroroseus]
MTLAEEFRTRNFSIYGQWTGVVCIFLCFALGVANIFAPALRIIFSIICLAYSPIILFIEVPFLLRICPTSSKFDDFIRRFASNYMRALIYIVMSAVQWVSLVSGASSLIAAAVFLLLAGIFYLLAGVRNQEFIGSKTLGGQGIAQMIV